MYLCFIIDLVSQLFVAVENALLGLEVKVGYQDGNSTEWKELLKGNVERRLTCEEMSPEEVSSSVIEV